MNREIGDIPALDRECVLYSAYLTDRTPDVYILEKYREAHSVSGALRNPGQNALEGALVAIACRHKFLTRLVDVYTRIFCPTCLVRKKWVLLLSILETSPVSHSYFDMPDGDGQFHLYVGMLVKMLQFILILGMSVVLLFPVHVVCTLSSSSLKLER